MAYDDGNGVGVVFPDLPGCVAEADTLDDALATASSVLAFHLDSAARDGETLPEPRAYNQLRQGRTAEDDWWEWDDAIVVAVAPSKEMEAAE